MSHTASEPNGLWYVDPVFLNISRKTHPKLKINRMSIFLLYTTTFLFRDVRQQFLHVLRFFLLLLSGSITLKVIFSHFHNYIFKAYKRINPHFEKPTSTLFQPYQCAPLFLHLKQWQVANAVSLIQLHYAQKPKNPE
jgi:hypothetical protein